jgi:hypothetical protein
VALAKALVNLRGGVCDECLDNGATHNNWLKVTPQSNVFSDRVNSRKLLWIYYKSQNNDSHLDNKIISAYNCYLCDIDKLDFATNIDRGGCMVASKHIKCY